jgi:DNA-binding MarR family transcriptional regulator
MLRILNGAGEPLSQIEISRRLISSRANVTKLTDFLEKQGLVCRNSCKDRRMNLIELTEKGSQFLEETLQSAGVYAEREMERLSREEQRQLYEILQKLV